ncbi:MAG: NADH-quinone oxidoreductase subunit J [Cyclobacteriaceae bacterium]|nr:NADH-quinone oxidoreductase subunit J [Cyclobacteriaceae bacterium]
MMQEVILYLFIGFSIMSVLVILLNRNVFYSALALLTCLISLSGIYGLLQAEFLAVTQLLIYAGGVLVLMIFGIMLTNRIAGKSFESKSHNWIPGILVTTSLLVVLVITFQNSSIKATQNELNTGNHIRNVGIELMSTYAAPFEVSGVLLLVCLIGAALTASSFKKSSHE